MATDRVPCSSCFCWQFESLKRVINNKSHACDSFWIHLYRHNYASLGMSTRRENVAHCKIQFTEKRDESFTNLRLLETSRYLLLGSCITMCSLPAHRKLLNVAASSVTTNRNQSIYIRSCFGLQRVADGVVGFHGVEKL